MVRVVAYALSNEDPNKIWVGCSDGRVFKIDWSTGTGSDQFWAISDAGLEQMTVASIDIAGRRQEVIFTAGEVDGAWKITVHELSLLGSSPTTQSRILYNSPQPVHIMKAVGEDPVLVAASEKRVLIGVLQSSEVETIDQIRSDFRVFESSEPVSSLDVRVSTRTSVKDVLFGRKRIAKVEQKIVDVVVGGAKGAIFVHNDLLGNLHRSQLRLPNLQPENILKPSKLHWHRKSVASAKWSRDGVYFILDSRLPRLTSNRQLYHLWR
jgi:NET1-associated nuclear protein 1 (U3 small nucleolar RNA-associated protein 17)